ncbi:MAG: hypothetical protein WCS96_12725 [Victivallales bacterium]
MSSIIDSHSKALLETLRNNSAFWSKLGFCYDPPRLDRDGKPVVFFESFDAQIKMHRDFYNAGIKLHTSILFSGWTGVGKYDYELTDRVLDSIFSCGDELLYIPRIKLNPPLDWCRANPEELLVYENGPREVEDIRALVGTPRHDLLGYESAAGYANTGTWKDDRPNVGGLISNQSFSSKKWLDDAGETLRRIVRHIEDGPFASRIPAYHVAYGACGESVLWGRNSLRMRGDYGIANRRAFFDWGISKHGSPEKLCQAWLAPSLTRENTDIPSVERREGGSKNASELFRGAAGDGICVDYDMFMSDVNADALEYFGKIVKRETGGKAVGAFYGYIMEVHNAAYTGHLAIERLLNSPYIDFFAAPKSYYRNAAGEPGGEMIPAQSVNRRKLWMDELDNGTHLGDFAYSQCADMADTRAIMWREASKNLAHGSGFWWMDLHGGWFDSPEMLREIAKIEDTAHRIRSRPGQSLAEVLFVADEDAFYHTRANCFLHRALMRDTLVEAQLCGVPVDIYRLKDLETLELGHYKLIVFLNSFIFEDGQWSKINARLPKGAVLLWFIAPGIHSHEYAEENIFKICGMRVREFGMDSDGRISLIPEGLLKNTPEMKWPSLEHADDLGGVNCPLFEVTGSCEPLARYPDGKIAMAEAEKDGRRNIYCALPLLKTGQFRVLMQDAGCHIFAPTGVVLYGDSRFIALFSRDGVEGELSLLRNHDFFEAISGSEWRDTNRIPLKMRRHDARFFIKIENEDEINIF